MRPALVIIEGAQGVGKTTVTDFIRNKMPYTNLYRLSGTKDTSPEGLEKAIKMYDNLLTYMKGLEGADINLVFDRTFFTEEVFDRLGYKEYVFTQEYNRYVQLLDKLDFDIYYITLYLKDTELFKQRLDRKEKTKVKYVDFDITNSVNQQNMYLTLSNELKQRTQNMNIYEIANDEPNMATDEIYKILDGRWKK